MFEANIFGGVWGWISDHTTATAIGLLTPVIIGFVVKEGKKLLTKFIKTKEEKELFTWIAGLADDFTDQLVAKYPKNELLKHVDEIVDDFQGVIQNIQPVSTKVAKRALEAAVGRKNGEPV